MSINSEVTRLGEVRDALVESVNSKGGALPGNATLWQVKAGVDAIQQGGSVDTESLTAAPEDVLEGKTFYGKDSKEPQTGTIPVYTELPDLTPVLTNAGSLLGTQIITPISNLKKGYYDIDGLDTIIPPALTIPHSEITVTDGVKDGAATVYINCNEGYIQKHEIAHAVSLPPVVPDACVVYLNSRGQLCVRTSWMNENNVVVGGPVTEYFPGSEWTIFEGLDMAEGSASYRYPGALSTTGVYIKWDGFNSLDNTWSVHSIVNSGPRESGTVSRVAWGFSKAEDGNRDDYATLGYWTDIYGMQLAAWCEKPQKDANGLSSRWWFPDDYVNREISPVHCASYGCSWVGRGKSNMSVLHIYGDHFTGENYRGTKKLFEPPWYEEEMGGYMGNATQYAVGNRLYLGADQSLGIGDRQSGVRLVRFALELKDRGAPEIYVNPLYTDEYRYI